MTVAGRADDDARPQVLVLVYRYPPMDPRVRHEVEALSGAGGFDVSVIGVALDGGRPGIGHITGADTAVAPLVVGPSRRLVRTLLDLCLGRSRLSSTPSSPFDASSLLSLVVFNLWVLRLALGGRWRVVHCHEHQSIPAAWLLTRLHRARLVYDMHENTVEHRSGRGRKAEAAIRLEAWLVPRADLVVTVGERMAAAIRDRYGCRAQVIGNWKPLQEYRLSGQARAAVRDDLGVGAGDLVVGYVGSLNRDRAVGPLIDAAARCPWVTVVIGGYGEREVELRAAATALDNVVWLGRVENERVGRLTAAFDAVYHCLDPDDPNHRLSAPNKLFEALAAGRPIIATEGVGELAELVERLGCGILVPAATTEALVGALSTLRDEEHRAALGHRAMRAGEDEYHFGLMQERLVDAYANFGVRAAP